MKPLKLKIKGINSFIEPQEIDFERLTENKFFGIFGPTGSGKSTVLDGITLALYGQVSRKSDNYINANLTSANVSYEFQISGANINRYRVEREFKLDKRTNRPRGGKCKIVDIKGCEEEVLAEGVTNVNGKCMEIIGLSCDDFTRTVVLPQGKFSEFLTLKGADRNNMLERLFKLEQYGEQLTSKIKKRGEKEETKNRELQGELNAYGEVDEEGCKAKKAELEEVEKKTKFAVEACEKAEETFKNSEEVWNLQKELKSYCLEAEQLEKEKPEINKEKKLVERSEKATSVIPFVEEWKNGEKSLNETKDKLKECDETFEAKKTETLDAEEKYNEIRSKKEADLPELQKKEEKAKEALALYKEAELIEAEIKKLSDEKKEIETKITSNEGIVKALEDQLQDKGKKLTLKETEKDELKVDLEFKSKVQDGVLAEIAFEHLKKQKEALETKRENKEKEQETLECDREETEKLRNAKKEELEKEKIVFNELKENPPSDTERLNKLYEQKTSFSAKWKSYNQWDKECTDCVKQVKEVEEVFTKATEKEGILKKECEALEEKKLVCVTENLAAELRKSLVDGEVCPVCGSVEHHLEHRKAMDSVVEKDVDMLLKKKKEEYDLAVQSVQDLNAKLRQNQTAIVEKKQQIEKLGDDFLQENINKLEKEYKQEKENLESYNRKISETEKIKDQFKSEFDVLNNKLIQENTELTAMKNSLTQYVGELEDVIVEFKTAADKYISLKTETDVERFAKAMQEISNREKEREILEEITKNLAGEISSLSEKKETAKNGVAENKQKFAVMENNLEHRNTDLENKWKDITAKVDGETDINGYKEKLSNEIKKLEEAFQTAEERKIQTEKELGEIQSLSQRLNGQKAELERNLEKRKKVMEQKIQEFAFHAPEEVERSMIPDETMAMKKQRIKDFEATEGKNVANTEKVKEKLGKRSISPEQWQAITEELNQLKAQQKELNEQKIRLELEVNELNAKLLKIGKIIEKKKKIEHTMSMLKELEKLFKGKKFVQFVATERLKYVSSVASKTLMEISSGSYELVTNAEGEFLIKDYKNGGIEREASTLSGGELFLASLALALALSTQIQLTNDAPLELFFLDEGFGTLDDNLLEEVISALEKLQNAKRAIGLISHVTEIKNRVPIKLMVTPAQMGKQGSKVRIELS